MKFKSTCFILLVLYLITMYVNQSAAADIVHIGLFSEGNLSGWEKKEFVGETLYSQVVLNDKKVLKAISQNSASGLIKKVTVDLDKTPILNWQWRIENRLSGSYDEKKKAGDDYAARLYVIISGGFAVWNTKAMNYVWSKHSRIGESWPNAFVKKNSMMIAIRSSSAPLSEWVLEKRNIKEDFKKLFDKDIQFIHAISLMSDTDNTKNSVTAYYGDIFFSSE